MTIKDALKRFVVFWGGKTESRTTSDLLDDVNTTLGAHNNPLINLTIDVDIAADTDLLGKVVGDLQENVHIYRDSIEGTLFKIEDYTGFSGIKEEQSGNYIALHAFVPGSDFEYADGVRIKAIRPGRTVTLDSDGILILRVPDKHSTIAFEASKDGYTSVKKEFDLDRLYLKAKPEPVPNEDTDGEG